MMVYEQQEKRQLNHILNIISSFHFDLFKTLADDFYADCKIIPNKEDREFDRTLKCLERKP